MDFKLLKIKYRTILIKKWFKLFLVKEEDVVILGRSGPGGPYQPHSYGISRHPPGLRPPPLTSHFSPTTWPTPPGSDPYAYR